MQTIVKFLSSSLIPQFLILCIATIWTLQASADTIHEDSFSSIQEILLLAENDQDIRTDVQSGDLIIPGAVEKPEREKKCVTVCDEWGKDCIINPSTGVRKCRRMCKAFGQECI